MAEDVWHLLDAERAALKKMGLDADVLIGQIRTLIAEMVSLNAEQEASKRHTREMTVAYRATRHNLHLTSSGALDTAMAAFGKSSARAKNIQQLRSRIRRPRPAKDAAQEPPPPP